MTTAVRCAILGCGMVAEQYARTLIDHPDVTLVACADVVPERAQRLAQRFTVPVAGTPDAVLFRSDVDGGPVRVDVVAVLTPPWDHADSAARVLEAGMSAYVEKPIAMRVGDAQRLLASAAARGLLVGGAPDTFLSEAQLTARAAIEAGRIGRP